MNLTDHEYRVPFDGSFEIKNSTTDPGEDVPGKKSLAKKLEKTVEEISQLQRVLYAQDKFAVLLVFQAMDAAGKDGTIRAVMSGVNPAGCHVSSFKSPSSEELDHDFLWRTTVKFPERGRIGVFNRSYYEEVLAVRVRPEYLKGQRIPDINPDTVWQERFESIQQLEQHMARNGTVILKFWLNVSLDEQKRRFMARLNDPSRYWKFSKSDLAERQLWPEYMAAYQDMLNNTSQECAPWFAIPADNKAYMRYQVAQVVVKTLRDLPLAYPEKTADQIAKFDQYREALESET